MNVNKLNSPSDRLSQSSGRFSLVDRYRHVLKAMVLSLSLGAVACGPGGGKDPMDKPDAGHEDDGGSAGMGGDGGTGGTENDAGGTGGTEVDGGGTGGTDGGTDPCEGIEVPGMVSVTLDDGEEGEAMITDQSSPFYGAGIKIPGAVLADSMRARFIVTGLVADNAPNGYNLVKDQSGVDIVAVPADRQMVMDEDSGNCVPNTLPLDPSLAMPSNIDKRPEVHSPAGIRGTIAFREGNGFELPGAGHTSQVTAGNTVARVAHLSEYIAVNSVPVIAASASAGADKRVTIDLSGSTDEGESGTMIYEGLELEVDGHSFSRVNGSPHLWRSDAPLSTGQHTLDLTVIGLNGAAVDSAMSQLTVDIVDGDPCVAVDCGDNGTCVDGACECDTHYAGADCGSCDPDSIPSSADGDVCVDDPCLPDPCNANADSCSVNGADQAVCACGAGYAGASCDSCDAGYRNYPDCELIPAPEITNLGIDCSSTGNFCFSGSLQYPATFNVTEADDCDANVETISSGSDTPGSVSAVNLVANNGSLTHTTGGPAGATIRITVGCDGDGGSDSAFVDFVLE